MSDSKLYNKIIINGETKIDLSLDDVTQAAVASGVYFHDATGARLVGSCTYDADTKDASANAAAILYGETAYVNGSKVTGNMPNRGGVTGTISDKSEQYTIQQGYHDGSGKVSIDSAEQSKLIAQNIRQGITLLGVAGSMSGSEDVHAQAKSVTPTFASQTIAPDAPTYNYLTQVTVNAIPVTEQRTFPSSATNSGYTVTVG